MEYELKESTDYSLFTFVKGNRGIDRKQVEAIKASMQENGVYPDPVNVNEKYEIIEGQHRYLAFKELGLPVLYVMKPGLTLKDCIKMNTSQKPWTTVDYIGSKADLGVPQYQVMRSLMDMYSDITPSVVIRAFTNDPNARRIQDGGLKIGDIRKGHKYISIVKTVREVFKNRVGTSLIAAIRIMEREGADLNLLEDSIKKNGLVYQGMRLGGTENCYAVMCKIYNRGRSTRGIDFKAYAVASKEAKKNV